MLGWVIISSVIWELLKKMVSVSPDSVSVYQVPKFSCPRSRCPLLPSSCQSSCREVFFSSVPSHGASKIWKLSIQILQQKQIMCFGRKLLKYLYYINCTSLLQEKMSRILIGEQLSTTRISAELVSPAWKRSHLWLSTSILMYCLTWLLLLVLSNFLLVCKDYWVHINEQWIRMKRRSFSRLLKYLS